MLIVVFSVCAHIYWHKWLHGSSETWFQIRLIICFAAYFHKLFDVGSPATKTTTKKNRQTIINRFVAHPFSVCLQIVNAFECICKPYINLYLYLQLYWSLYTLMSEQICAVFFWCARDAHVVPKNSSHVLLSQHTVPSPIVNCCSDFLLLSKSLNCYRKNCEYTFVSYIDVSSTFSILNKKKNKKLENKINS